MIASEVVIIELRKTKSMPILLKKTKTQGIRFGRKTDKIAKFSVLDKKNEIGNFGENLDEKWPTDRK